MIVKPVEQLVVGDLLPYDPSNEPYVERFRRFVSVLPIEPFLYPVKIVKVMDEVVKWEIEYMGHTVQAEAPAGTIIGVYAERDRP